MISAYHKELKETYDRLGYVIYRGLFQSDEVQKMMSERDAILDHLEQYKPNVEYRSFFLRGKKVERILYIHTQSSIFSDILHQQKLNEFVSVLLNEQKDIKMLIDKLIFKPPGQKGYGPHQDMAWWKKEGYREAMSALIAIDESDKANGAVQFLPSTHDRLITAPQDSRDLTMNEIRQFNQSWEQPHLNPGDALFFHGLTIHRSDANRSRKYRSTYYVSFALPEITPSH